MTEPTRRPNPLSVSETATLRSPAEDRVDGTNDADEPHRDPEQGRFVLDSCQGLEIEDTHETGRARIKNDGQEDHGVGDDEDDTS
jgi:hypothetical protein